ncbi:hypothetical protein ACFQ3F_00845 [Nocardioides ginsengisoli]|uniref:GGDEF domain-containing protein n=1 Tax=Nocardioides ginsengisoli TaxID=363868 RepID=A0ABW3VVY3_9ACTN
MDDVRPGVVVPARGLRLADALVHREAVEENAADFGVAYAEDGQGLDVCLAELDDTFLAVLDEPPPPRVVRRVALAWADALQNRYNEHGCEDPMTGLNSIHHLQSQVAALYHAAGDGWLADTDIARTYALVVVEMSGTRDDVDPGFGALEGALRRASAAELIRQRMPTCDQVAELSPRRLVALARRTDGLDRSLADAVRMMSQRLQLSPSGGTCRGWTEALPMSPQSARHLLDELAR